MQSSSRSHTGSAARSGRPRGGSIRPGGRPGIAASRPSRMPSPSICGSAPSSASVYGCSGRSKRSSTERLLDDLAGVHHGDVVGGLGDDAHVVGDQDHRHLVLDRAAPRAGRGSGPARSRRARSSARRRSAAAGCRRARSRSSRAGACRPSSGAGSRRAAGGAFGDAHLVEQLDRALARLRPCAMSKWRRSVSVICVPIVSVGFSDVIGSWKIIAISRPRMSSSSRSFSPSGPGRRTAPRRETIFAGGFGSRPMIESAVTDLPQPDSPTMPSVLPLLDREADRRRRRWTTPSRV